MRVTFAFGGRMLAGLQRLCKSEISQVLLQVNLTQGFKLF